MRNDSSERVTSRAFVGRVRELAELTAGLEEASSGRGRLFLVSGEPGIGKTRLADELGVAAAQQGLSVLWGRCREGGGAPAYWPWVQLLRGMIRSRDAEPLAAALGAGADSITLIIPELRQRFPDLAAASASFEHEDARFSLFDSTTNFLKNAAERQPLLLILDDLHSSDRASLLLLRFLAEQLRDAHILLLATYRDLEVERQPEVARILGEIGRDGQHIPLGGLSEPEIARFVHKGFGLSPSDGAVAHLHGITRGNPFFVDEIIRSLAASGQLDEFGTRESLRIPGSVREAIRRRLRPLSESTRELLTTAAVIGREFDLASLEAVCGLPTEKLLGLLGEAEAEAIVVRTASGPRRYAFFHALIRETLYEDLPRAARIALHREIAEALQRLHRENSDDRLPEIAHHFYEAALDGESVGKAIDYSARAAAHTMRLLAYEEAAQHFERALQLLDLAEPDAVRRFELLLGLGEASWAAGKSSKAKAAFRQAADLALAAADGRRLARAALGYGGPYAALVNEGADPLALDFLERAFAALAEQEKALRARVMSRLAATLTLSRDDERRTALARQAIELAREVGDSAVLGQVLNASHLALWGPDSIEEALALAEEIVRLGEATGDPRLAAIGYGLRLAHHLELGDIEAATRDIALHARRVEAMHQPLRSWMTAAHLAMRALLEGRFGEVEALASAVLERGKKDPNVASFFGIQMTFLMREQGRLEEVVEPLNALVARFPAFANWRVARGWIYAELGRADEARRELELLAAHDFTDLPRNTMWMSALWGLAEIAAAVGHTRHAARIYQLLEPSAGHCMVITGAVCAGSIARSLGLLATTLGRFSAAQRHFDRALEQNESMGAAPWVARTRYEYSRMLIARGDSGDRERARELLDQSLHTARALGMIDLVTKAERFELEAFGATGISAAAETSVAESPSVPEGRPARDGVFRLEGDYWTIAYEGESFRLKDSMGLRLIAQLLRHPGREVHVVDLATAGTGGVGEPPIAKISAAEIADSSLHTMGGAGAADHLFDARAKAAYKRRLEDLQEDLREAMAFNDRGRIERAQGEIDFIARELARGVGLGGRHRKAASMAERARINVTRRIRAAIEKIGAQDPSLGRHLATTIKTGAFCSYDPDPRSSRGWKV